jgi:hypothetical protein
MKTQKRTKTAPNTQPGLSFQPIPTLAQTTEAFAARNLSKNKASDGANQHVADFLKIAKFITESYPSFDFNTFLSLGQGLAMPAAESAELFNDWTEQLVRDGRCKKIHGCYYWPTYHFI